ncbi:tRNA wybutosine-synthesizing protein 2 homolog [Branchiostoma floridae]|uniref:tRNA(Phe) (4-demethylwyosine(37)-C(7)) aminocarboxypropyltransferase n=1 Tax=Branchiostoma floridae TaxID=7739 RepID=A0A9J7MB80_BRAFL|nr:tRNA wybutosine-synthesizing protein 2 homolog [Branchiostoma floridae]
MAAPMDFCVAVKKEDAQNVRKKLEAAGILDRSRKIQILSTGEAVIPVKNHTSEEINDILGTLTLDHRILDGAPLQPSRRKQHISQQDRLRTAISKLLDKEELDRELETDIPTRWEKHGDLILLPEFSFRSPKWKEIQAKFHQQDCENQGLPCQMYRCFWQLITESLGGTRLARKGTIQDDLYRSPRVELLLGDHGWVGHTDNGIRYTFDVTRCMFSPGNITEKLRVARMGCEGQTVVDLYAGIGYFTLPFLVHGKAAEVHACEWNPAAVEALQKNLQINKVQDRCTVHHGDNRQVCPRGVADRVNLGLIPSSRSGWPVACAALRPTTGGILHIHENVTTFHKNDTYGGKISVAGTMANTKTHDFKQDSSQHTSNSFEEDVSSEHTEICGSSKNKDASSEFSVNHNLQKEEHESQIYCKQCCHKVHCSRESEAGTCDLKGFATSSDSGESVQMVKDNVQNTGKDNSGFVAIQDESCQRQKTHQTDSAVSAKATSVKEEWNLWADRVANDIQRLLSEMQGGTWQTRVLHIEHVKSYAPHVDHLVVDLECRPLQT